MIFQSLFANALFYNREGGKIIVKVEKKENEIVCSVEDTGWGIDDEDKSRVFSKYFRGEIGKPGRETSVRQMVDRVAKTISDSYVGAAHAQ